MIGIKTGRRNCEKMGKDSGRNWRMIRQAKCERSEHEGLFCEAKNVAPACQLSKKLSHIGVNGRNHCCEAKNVALRRQPAKGLDGTIGR